jgi:hypothetical protein
MLSMDFMVEMSSFIFVFVERRAAGRGSFNGEDGRSFKKTQRKSRPGWDERPQSAGQPGARCSSAIEIEPRVEPHRDPADVARACFVEVESPPGGVETLFVSGMSQFQNLDVAADVRRP